MYSWIVCTTIGIGTLFWWLRRARNKRESMSDADVASVIEHYIHGGSRWEWGDFVEVRFRNPRLERLRKTCLEAESKLPDEREAFLSELIGRLRAGKSS